MRITLYILALLLSFATPSLSARDNVSRQVSVEMDIDKTWMFWKKIRIQHWVKLQFQALRGQTQPSVKQVDALHDYSNAETAIQLQTTTLCFDGFRRRLNLKFDHWMQLLLNKNPITYPVLYCQLLYSSMIFKLSKMSIYIYVYDTIGFPGFNQLAASKNFRYHNLRHNHILILLCYLFWDLISSV